MLGCHATRCRLNGLRRVTSAVSRTRAVGAPGAVRDPAEGLRSREGGRRGANLAALDTRAVAGGMTGLCAEHGGSPAWRAWVQSWAQAQLRGASPFLSDAAPAELYCHSSSPPSSRFASIRPLGKSLVPAALARRYFCPLHDVSVTVRAAGAEGAGRPFGGSRRQGARASKRRRGRAQQVARGLAPAPLRA